MFEFIYLISATIFSLLVNSIFLKYSTTLGTRNPIDGTIIRWGTQSKPSIGGISFFILFLSSITTFSILNPEKIAAGYEPKHLGFFLAATAAFMMGLADDAYNTRPWLKFGVQLGCGIILIASGMEINLFENIYLNWLLTLLWVVGMMNSINMLDNMDSITAGVSIVTIMGAIISSDKAFFIKDTLLYCTLLGVLGALIGFLHFNWNPSKMYMGDTGSQFLGLFLAAIGIEAFWNSHHGTMDHDFLSSSKAVITVALAFLLPLIDTTLVIIKRMSLGKSPFIGGRDHTTHSLAYLGLSDKQVAICFITLSSIASVGIYLINYKLDWTWTTLTIFTVLLSVVFMAFYYITIIRSRIAKPEQVELSDKEIAG